MSLEGSPSQRLMGVDPSFNRTGWALLVRACRGKVVLAGFGIVVPRGNSRAQRLLSIQKAFQAVLAKCRPSRVVFEQPGKWMRRVGSSRWSVEAMAMARGVMLAACAELGVEAVEVDFQVARRALLGSPNAGADAVIGFVRGMGLKPLRRPRGGVDLDVANAVLMAAYGLSLSGRTGGLARELPDGRWAKLRGPAIPEPATRPT
jgi:Holliday junction resolvasome RuvABC endonuclease subunit